MFNKIARVGLVAIVVAVPLLAAIWLIFFDIEVGMAQNTGIQYAGAPEPPLSPPDYSLVPQSVIDSAAKAAADVVGKNQKKVQEVVDQLVETYVQSRNLDFVVVFNSGGWGWNSTHTSGWGSILDGIETQLQSQGYETLVLNYRRTSSGIAAIFKEFYEAAMRYPNKANELAMRIKFLTDNLPDLRVIIAGESTGTVISDKTMVLLKDDSRVYSIQTGVPFWHKNTEQERTLLLNNNGVTIDTFSYGDVPAIIWATVKGWFGMKSTTDTKGNILFWVKAPGHDYSWQYPGVYNNVVDFIKKNFSKKD
jgi:hypothetical protein